MATLFEAMLAHGDLRSIGQSNQVATQVTGQKSFDELFRLLFHPDRKIVMRAADAVEKITSEKPSYLHRHKAEILSLCTEAERRKSNLFLLGIKRIEQLLYRTNLLWREDHFFYLRCFLKIKKMAIIPDGLRI